MDTAGNLLWSAAGIGAYEDLANAVNTDSDENVYIAGTFANDLKIGSTTINSLGWGANSTAANAGIDAFIAKYDKNGVFQWAKTIGNASDISLDDMEITSSNKILVAGFVRGPDLNIAGTSITIDTAIASYFTVLDKSGNLLWYKLDSKRNKGATPRGICADKYGNCYAGGEFTGDPTLNFDSITVSAYAGIDGYIAKLMPPLSPLVSSDYTIICPGQNVNFSVIQDGYPLSYQWDFTGGTPASSSIPNPVVNYPVAGTYTVTLTMANGHETTTTTLTIQVSPSACATSLAEYVNNIKITIAPNPVATTAVIHISDIDLTKNTSFQLYNYLGQEIGVPILITNNTFALDVESVPPGGYFFNIIQNNAVIKTEKLIVINH
nr:PKD domain-containing protein [Bacteroidota bacterium]